LAKFPKQKGLNEKSKGVRNLSRRQKVFFGTDHAESARQSRTKTANEYISENGLWFFFLRENANGGRSPPQIAQRRESGKGETMGTGRQSIKIQMKKKRT